MDWLSDSDGESVYEYEFSSPDEFPSEEEIRENRVLLVWGYQGNLRGLSSERILKFEHFAADESLVGENCLVCMSDLIIGMQMVRLSCHVDHILCKTCVDKWFEDHKTCPTCRHEFN